MAGQLSFRLAPMDASVAPKGVLLSVSATHTPRQNHLLAALPAKEYELLLPNLEAVPLPVGWIIHSAGELEKYLYFPTAGIVSRYNMSENGASAEFAVTGNEGVIGIALFLGGDSTPGQAVVVSEGYAYRLKAASLKNELDRNHPLMHLLLHYTLALMAQTAQSVVCNRHHSLEQRLCVWILSCQDRLASNELTMTQELIAQMLGMRRESITEAAGKLQKMGLIHYSRGHIVLLDRSRLEAQACECYAVVKREYDRLRHPESAHGHASLHGGYRQHLAHMGEDFTLLN